MTFTAQDYMGLVKLLDEHPEWKAELRRLLLTEELLSLPETVRQLSRSIEQLTKAQQSSEERLRRLEETVEKLAEAQRRTEERLGRLEETIEKLTEAQRRTEEQIRYLAEDQGRIWDKLSKVDGRTLELEYREKAPAYFGHVMRKTRVISREDLANTLEGKLPVEELRDVLFTDMVVSGQPRDVEGEEMIWLVVEVSSVVDERDVIRAKRRAELLKKAGYTSVPVVAGERITMEAEAEVRRQKVVMLRDGVVSLWDEVLAEARSKSRPQ
ncbi:hypothetical protein J7M22_05105 [Candidatus Poribacteria bacterium]|nr:hypothetical protein [Candidatus Poribacteria bacterium]